MAADKIARVAVEGAAYSYDRPYSYRVPPELRGAAQPGARVVVPFGMGNGRRQGILLALEDDAGGEAGHCKPLLEVADKIPLISPALLRLGFWLKERTYCTLYEALRLMLPAGLHLQVTKLYRLSAPLPPETLALLPEESRRVAVCLASARAPMPREALLRKAGLPPKSQLPEQLEAQGLLSCEDGVLDHSPEATERMVRPALPEDEAAALLADPHGLTKKQKSVLKTVMDAGTATVREIAYFSGASAAVVTALVKKGVLEQYEKRVFREPYRAAARSGEPETLSPAQERAFRPLAELAAQPQARAALLHGVTGSGKTLIYMKLIEQMRARGRTAIVLVPEISLTPQAVARFYARFGRDVAVLHSGLSLGERLDEWQRLKDGRAGIAVGTRSAVFAPLSNLGLIIVDEEQEYTYKSESSPRYHARDVARFRCADEGALLLLASATPSLESFYAAAKGRYRLVRLSERYGEAVLPRVLLVDMKQELLRGNEGPISEPLAQELAKNLKDGAQSILLLNRRGYNTFVGCAQCGHVLTCPNCSIALTYHAANGRLMCHYCGYSSPLLRQCPACGGAFLHYAGTGTQKAEEAVAELFPRARILRMDTDTTFGRYSHEKILEEFGSGRYDILIGTQMVAKGLDFPNVTLVGVLSADNALYMDDFRAPERTFSLLTQVVGRAGRGERPGRAVIQTQTPENEVLRLAAAQDYDAFYEKEIALRRELLYPPFCDICEIGFTGTEERAVQAAAADFFTRLRAAVLTQSGIPVRVMGPSPAGVLRVAGRYRYRILVKCRADKRFRALLSTLLAQSGEQPLYRKVSLFADMNPLDLL